jgi:hypothetical protein
VRLARCCRIDLHAGLDSLVKDFTSVGVDDFNPEHDERGLVIESALRLDACHVARAAGSAMNEAQILMMIACSQRSQFLEREDVAALQAAGRIG